MRPQQFALGDAPRRSGRAVGSRSLGNFDVSAPSRQFDRSDCTYCPIRERAVCAYCEPSELEALNAAKSYQTYQKGQEIIAAGEQSPFVATIVSGVVSLSRTQADGRRQLIGLQFASDFLGGAFRPRASCDAIATTEVLLCRFERKAFDKLMAETPNLRDRLLDITLDELDAVRDWMAILGLKTAREKVAAFLLKLVTRARASGSQRFKIPEERVTVDLPITRGEIGECLGLTIETVSRQLSKLKVDAVIGFDNSRGFELLDEDALREAAGDFGAPATDAS